jgi:hypothetical protein
MRDYRDAKAMAQTLRESLKTRHIDLTHSAALELIAKAFGFKDWQVLAARIEADRAPPLKSAQKPAGASSTLYCSFCGKSQHEVAKLIAGPNVFICDECAGLCDDILWEQGPGTDAEPRQALAGKSSEELVVLKAKARSSVARGRRLLDAIRALDGESGRSVPADTAGGSEARRWFALRQSSGQRAAYLAAVEARIAASQRLGEAAAVMLAERGVSLDPGEERPR